jgi:quinoprotein glucose dehydrogenase
MAERHGLIVTSTGLLFVAGSDGKLRAYEADTGNVLWTVSLPAGSEGIPAMYEVNGRQYLVVPSSSGINAPGGHAEAPNLRRGYVVFALPERSQKD